LPGNGSSGPIRRRPVIGPPGMHAGDSESVPRHGPASTGARRGRPGGFWAELPCPLKASHGPGRRTRTRARPATPGTISGDYALQSRTTSCMAPARLSQASSRSRSSSRSSFTRSAPAGDWHGATAAAPGIRSQRHQQRVSSEGSPPTAHSARSPGHAHKPACSQYRGRPPGHGPGTPACSP